MNIIACNRCGEAVQDDSWQAVGVIHLECGGTFVEMTQNEASLLELNDSHKIKIVSRRVR